MKINECHSRLSTVEERLIGRLTKRMRLMGRLTKSMTDSTQTDRQTDRQTHTHTHTHTHTQFSLSLVCACIDMNQLHKQKGIQLTGFIQFKVSPSFSTPSPLLLSASCPLVG